MSADLELDASPLANPGGLRADTLAGSVMILLAMTVVQRLIGFLRGVLVCRWLDAEQLGQWDVCYAFLMLAAPLAVLGLPGSFGRYFEYYRQRGQLRLFLRRTSVGSVLLGATAMLLVFVLRDHFSQLIFGRAHEGRLVAWLAAALGAIIVHNFLNSLFIAGRQYRVVTMLQFTQTVGFALFSIPLLMYWEFSATSVVVAFMMGSLASAALSLSRLRQIWHAQHSDAPVAQDGFWSKLIPFALWIWLTNLATNLFEVVDRYMLVHCSGMDATHALEQVGNFHSSRVVPLLFLSIAALLGSMLTPHLSHDWEGGRRDAVIDRLNLVVKLLAWSSLASAVGVLLIAPYLFEIGFHSKFSGGLAILPCTLAYCTWFGIGTVAMNYLYCVERAALATLTLVVGLAVNIGLNLVLLQPYGLYGVAWSTAAAHLAALLTCFFLSRAQGMRWHRGTWLLVFAPATLVLGAVGALATLLVLSVAALTGNMIFTPSEKQMLHDGMRSAAGKLTRRRAIASFPESLAEDVYAGV